MKEQEIETRFDFMKWHEWNSKVYNDNQSFKIKQDNEEQRWSAKHSDYCQNKIFFKHRRERDSQIEWRNLVRNTLLLREDYHRTEEIEKESDENNEDENKLIEEKSC